MPRQFSLKTLLWLMALVAVGCATLPRPIGAVRRWLWPPTTFHICILPLPSHMVVVEEDEALLGIASTD